MYFDRRDGARALAAALRKYEGRQDAVVLAIPRGGLVTGGVLAGELGLELDVILTKKIGHPENPEYAIGVVNLSSESLDQAAISRDSISPGYIESEIKRIRALLRQRYEEYRGGRPPVPLQGKVAIIADDGVATGNTVAAAVRTARLEGAKRIVVAVPVGPPETVAELSRLADEVVCPLQPRDFFAIGRFYERFDQVEDAEAIRLLKESASSAVKASRAGGSRSRA